MQSLSRRNLIGGLGQNLIAVALFDLVASMPAYARTAADMEQWIQKRFELADSLARGVISPARWQLGMDALYASVEVALLKRDIDFDQVVANIDFGDKGEVFTDVSFLSGSSDTATSVALETKLAAVKRGRSIYPHGHDNMVSAFLTIGGEFHVRQFDKLWEDSDALYIRKTTDEMSKSGSWSSISDERNNIHWLTSHSDHAYLFSTKITAISPDRRVKGRVPIDPNGPQVNPHVIRASIITHADAEDRFG